MNKDHYQPGITAGSLAAILFGMLVGGMLLQWEEVVVRLDSFSGEHTIPFPPMIVLLVLIGLGAAAARFLKFRLLSRAELLCVLYALLLATPLMTQGFWHRFMSLTATLPRDAKLFQQMDAYSDKLWPHGANLIEEKLAETNREELQVRGTVTRETIEFQPGMTASMPVLSNDRSDQVSSIRLRVAAKDDDGEAQLLPGELFMVSVLARPGDESNKFGIHPDSQYFCRLYADGAETFSEVFSSTSKGKVTFIQKKGFVRVGAHGFKIPLNLRDYVEVEFGLAGRGRVALWDTKMFSVDALESAFTGKQLVTQSDFNQLPDSEKTGLVVKPDNMWSWSGIKFLVAGHVPWGQWVSPIFAWTTFFMLLLLASLSMNVILRKQWMENERYLMPMTRIPMALIGEQDTAESEPSAAARIWRNPMMWTGMGTALVYTLIRGWHFYNPKVPNLNIHVPLQPYFGDPGYGAMWSQIHFSVSLVFVSIAMFMDLSVLFSLVIGFFMFRSLYWLGESTGWVVHSGYPFMIEQQAGAYLMYAVLILVFSRKYLWRVVKACVNRDRDAWKEEMMSYPAALGLLAGCIILSLVWANWVGVSLSGMLVFFLFLLVIALIAAKIRAECGAPFSYLGPFKAAIVLVLLGGAATFGSEAFLFAMFVGWFVGGTPFYLIPGAQMELAEWGRRFRVVPRHLVYTTVLGILGGMIIGGWVFLSNSYAIGGSSIRYGWAYDSKIWYFSEFNAEMGRASASYLGEATAEPPKGDEPIMKPKTVAYFFAAGVTAGVAILRQLYAGFWFHPIGFILSTSWLAQIAWGSCLVAWTARLVVLKLGGAATVRTKLQPFFVGVFLGALAGSMVMLASAGYLQSQGVERVFRWSTYMIP